MDADDRLARIEHGIQRLRGDQDYRETTYKSFHEDVMAALRSRESEKAAQARSSVFKNHIKSLAYWVIGFTAVNIGVSAAILFLLIYGT